MEGPLTCIVIKLLPGLSRLPVWSNLANDRLTCGLLPGMWGAAVTSGTYPPLRFPSLDIIPLTTSTTTAANYFVVRIPGKRHSPWLSPSGHHIELQGNAIS